MNRRLVMLSLALCSGFGGVARGDAQNYPTRPLRIVVRYPAPALTGLLGGRSRGEGEQAVGRQS
ncbi:MAG TPA: hypothetical protein VGO08_05810 [Burkholderiales bacterium]|nr:hypothetical protein [Burkholderiales bacterium]